MPPRRCAGELREQCSCANLVRGRSKKVKRGDGDGSLLGNSVTVLRPLFQKHPHSKRFPMVDRRALKILQDEFRIRQIDLNCGLVELRIGIVIRAMTFVLKRDKSIGEILNFPWKHRNAPILTGIFRKAVIQSAIDLLPSSPGSRVRTNQGVRAAFRKCMKERIISCTQGPLEIRLPRLLNATPNKIPGCRNKVKRLQTSRPLRRLSR